MQKQFYLCQHILETFSSSILTSKWCSYKSYSSFIEEQKSKKDVLNVGLRDPKAMDYYRELLELGVTNSNVRMGDLKKSYA